MSDPQNPLADLDRIYSAIPLVWRQSFPPVLKNPAPWNMHDGTIKALVLEFQTRLKPTGMPLFDWKLIKAMIWVETNPNKKDWNTYTMQIGKFNDKGIHVVLNGTERMNLILPPGDRTDLTLKSIASPEKNIKAGIAYLLNRMCRAEPFEEFDPKHPQITEHTVKKGETLDAIAKLGGCSTQWLLALNAGNSQLAIGQVVRVQSTLRGQRIKEWFVFTPENLHANYNGNGDPHYARKIRYALGVMAIIDAQGRKL